MQMARISWKIIIWKILTYALAKKKNIYLEDKIKNQHKIKEKCKWPGYHRIKCCNVLCHIAGFGECVGNLVVLEYDEKKWSLWEIKAYFGTTRLKNISGGGWANLG